MDTTGALSRVSRLFRGHPELIFGFNIFLPPGYKIETNEGAESSDPQQPMFLVRTPEGTHKVGDQGLVPLVIPSSPSSPAPAHHGGQSGSASASSDRSVGPRRGRKRKSDEPHGNGKEDKSSYDIIKDHIEDNNLQVMLRQPTPTDCTWLLIR